MKWPFRLSILLTVATFGLIYVGGLVTSTHSSLAVPDWPLSYGRLMPKMVGGILYEHGHRMIAGFVGILTVITAIVFTLREERSWMKKAIWTAVALVILQAILGGLTVLFRLPWFISASHATLAQTFFSLVVAVMVWSSPAWLKPTKKWTEPQNIFPHQHIALMLTIVLFIQLILGSLVRHTGYLLTAHIAGAVTIIVLAAWSHHRVWSFHFENKLLVRLSTSMVALVLFQIILGISSLVLLMSRGNVFPNPLTSAAFISLHVAMGAAILGLSVAITLFSYKGTQSQPINAKTKLADYLTLTKPGISFMAGITALAGFVLGSDGHVDLLKLFHTTVGTLMIAGGAGTLNMLIEKDSDAKMKRTRTRPIPAGRLKPGEVLLVGTLLSVCAVVYLAWAVNTLTALVAGFTLCIYLYVYTPLKKITSLCTVVGAVAGALPPVIGWAAATNGLGFESWVLFGIIFCWQFPHFFSLAWLYKDDYAQGGLHMLPVQKDHVPDARKTAMGTLVNSVGLLFISLIPPLLGLTGSFYVFVAAALGLWMTVYSIKFFIDQSTRNARKLFFASLVYVPLLVIFMVIR